MHFTKKISSGFPAFHVQNLRDRAEMSFWNASSKINKMAAVSEVQFVALSVMCYFVIYMEASKFLQIPSCWGNSYI